MAAKGEYRGLIYRNNADLQAWLAKRPPRPRSSPTLPIIDPHHHLWDTPAARALFPARAAGRHGGGHNIVSTVFLECQSMFRAAGPEEMARWARSSS